jgi:hypothetical protein
MMKRLHQKQREMRARQARTKRRGWPLGKSRTVDTGEVSMSELRFWIHRNLMSGCTVDETVRFVREKFGATVLESTIRRWRRSGYQEGL